MLSTFTVYILPCFLEFSVFVGSFLIAATGMLSKLTAFCVLCINVDSGNMKTTAAA